MTAQEPRSQTPVEPGHRGAWPSWLLVAAGTILLAGAVWGIYGRLIHAPLIFDDFRTLDDNPSLLKLWPLWNFSGEACPLRPSPGTPVSARPLVNLTFAVNYHIGVLDPTGYRIGNIIIHIGAAIILWGIVRRTLRLEFFGGCFERVAGLLGFASALVWAVHPLNTESVAYVTQRTESLMGLFYLATMYAAIRYWTAEGRAARCGWLILATACGVLGALSKEMMASVPAVALLYERTFVSGSFWQAVRRSWPLYLGLIVSWIPQVVINYHGPRTPSAGFDLGLPVYMWWYTEAEVLLLYLKLTFWPWPLVIHYEIPYKETLAVAWPWLLPVALLILATLVLVAKRTSAGFVAATVFIVLSPTLLVPLVSEIVAERRMYVPLAAIVPLVIVGVFDVARRAGTTFLPRSARRPLFLTIATTTALATLFVLLDVRRLESYVDARTMLEETLVHEPDDLSVLINLGITMAKAGELSGAMDCFDRAARLYNDSPYLNYKLNNDAPNLFYNLGLVYEKLERPDEAIENYEKALVVMPNYAEAHYNLGLLLHKYGVIDGALEQYEEAIHCKPNFAAAHCNLGALLATLGERESAIEHLEEGARLDPDAGTLVNLTDAYAAVGRSADAIRAAESAVKLAQAKGQDELASQIEAWLENYRQKIAEAKP
jgi:protein O-mannosyl-transferase